MEPRDGAILLVEGTESFPREMIARLAEGTGLSVEGVYRMALSEETVKANAMLAGLGHARDSLVYNIVASVACPAAFALLLAAVSAGALAKGVGLVLVFSVGLAATLVAIGIGVVKAAGFAGRFMQTEKVAPYAAMASAVLVTLIGAVTLYNSLKHII